MRKIRAGDGRLAKLLKENKSDAEIVEELFLADAIAAGDRDGEEDGAEGTGRTAAIGKRCSAICFGRC